MPRQKAADELEFAQGAAIVVSSFLEIATEAGKLGEKDIAMMALKRARSILRRRLLREDNDDGFA